MTFDVTGVLRDAWRMAIRDRDVLLGVAGVLLFVPQFAVLLYWSDPPAFPGFAAEEAVQNAYVTASGAWFATNGFGLLVASVLILLGQLAILLLYVDRRRLDVAGALLATLPVFLPALLATMLTNPIVLSVRIAWPLILLGAYLQGRLLLVFPILLAERPLSIARAFRQSWTRTRGHGLVLAGLACIAVLGGPIAAAPFQLLGRSFDGLPLANPAVAALLDGAAALAVVAGAVAGLLIQVAAWRRLSPAE